MNVPLHETICMKPFRIFIKLCVKGEFPLTSERIDTNERADFTQGSILKKLSVFMLPILGALVLQAA